MTLEEQVEQITRTRSSLFLMVAQAHDDALRILLDRKEGSYYLRNMVIKTLLARLQCKRMMLMGE